ncbi:MAG: PAAR domain-containing protein [Nitriliruptorales bacterium]|nr:PAAR domain-containing protein [Nitriliruptorales bacterium]
MSQPAARVGDLTATGDPITGPGAATVLIMSLPAARVGDLVSGPACNGAISLGSTTVMIANQPAARVGDQVTGVNPASGASVTTAIAPPGAPTVLIGG